MQPKSPDRSTAVAAEVLERLRDNQRRMSALQQELDACRARNKALQQEREELVEARSRVQNVQADNQRLRDRVGELVAALDGERRARQQAEESGRLLEAQVAELERTVQMLRQHIGLAEPAQ